MPIENISIPDYLKSLDYEQLKRTQQLVAERINEIDAEDKVTLFIVDNGYVNVACFRENEFQKAKDTVCSLIKSCDFLPDDEQREHPKIHKKKIPVSEVAGWMEINT